MSYVAGIFCFKDIGFPYLIIGYGLVAGGSAL